MAPFIAESPKNEVTVPIHVKSIPTSETTEVKPIETIGTTDNKPKIRRIIDEEGGTTTASVRHQIPTFLLTIPNHLPVSSLSSYLGSWRKVPTS